MSVSIDTCVRTLFTLSLYRRIKILQRTLKNIIKKIFTYLFLDSSVTQQHIIPLPNRNEANGKTSLLLAHWINRGRKPGVKFLDMLRGEN
jgi:hypothetical protein